MQMMQQHLAKEQECQMSMIADRCRSMEGSSHCEGDGEETGNLYGMPKNKNQNVENYEPKTRTSDDLEVICAVEESEADCLSENGGSVFAVEAADGSVTTALPERANLGKLN